MSEATCSRTAAAPPVSLSTRPRPPRSWPSSRPSSAPSPAAGSSAIDEDALSNEGRTDEEHDLIQVVAHGKRDGSILNLIHDVCGLRTATKALISTVRAVVARAAAAMRRPEDEGRAPPSA